MSEAENRATPGPWVASELHGQHKVLYEPNDTVVAMTYPFTDHPLKDRARADARFIAAAPDLLEAAKEAMYAVHYETSRGVDAAMSRLEQAVSKAEGRHADQD